jgi:hypothetical protein
MRFRLRTLFLWQAAIVVILVTASALRIIQFHYPRIIENNPLLAPIQVVSVTNNALELADGRRLIVEYIEEPLADVIRGTNHRVDIEVDGSSYLIYVQRRGWICGNSSSV